MGNSFGSPNSSVVPNAPNTVATMNGNTWMGNATVPNNVVTDVVNEDEQEYNTLEGNVETVAQTGGARKVRRSMSVKKTTKKVSNKVKKYEECTVVELKEKAAKRKVKGYSSMRKDELIKSLRSLRM